MNLKKIRIGFEIYFDALRISSKIIAHFDSLKYSLRNLCLIKLSCLLSSRRSQNIIF